MSTEQQVGSASTTAEQQVGSAAANTANAPAPTDWHGGLSEDLKGYVASKGFKDPASVVDSYRNLEKLIGVKEKLLQVPDNLGDQKAMEDVWKRLGRPEKPEEYGIKSENEKFGKWYSETAHKLGLNRNQAETLFKEYDSFVQAEQAQSEAEFKAESEKMISDIKTKWGAAFDQNINVAKQAANQFGIDTDMLNKLENSLGFAKTMDLLHTIGSKIGESDFTSGQPPKADKILTPNQARERINQLINDKDWSQKYINGGVQERQEMERLNKMVLALS